MLLCFLDNSNFVEKMFIIYINVFIYEYKNKSINGYAIRMGQDKANVNKKPIY